ncbi:MAG: ABC transporter ATP-binding protein [Coriobacteriia bacterium]|nr:ABC transporter ATP-binding protein [Coriobacteriia bacterium]
MSLIQLQGLHKTYKTGKLEFEALRGIDLDIEEGQLVAIVGPSGSGKSTMLNMITGIDRPTDGSVTIAGDRIDQMKEDKLAAWRGDNVGIVFQFFQLFPTLTALENVMLPMDFLRRGTVGERKDRARERLELVGLGDKIDNLPSELSGGQQQRVAIARALVNEPKVIIGDEPTGNLDSKTEAAMFELFDELNARGTTVIYVTHSPTLADKARVTVELVDGQLV